MTDQHRPDVNEINQNLSPEQRQKLAADAIQAQSLNTDIPTGDGIVETHPLHANVDQGIENNLNDQQSQHLNADPLSGEPGAHPIGTGVGAAGGGAAGAAIGAVGGPVGAVVGGVVGAVVGGLAGKGAAEAINPTEEDHYWREQSVNMPYYQQTLNQYPDVSYQRDYQQAYRLGYEERRLHPADTSFSQVEAQLEHKWQQVKGESRLTWQQAKHASQDAWQRLK